MLIDVRVPAAGESITSANLARWHKQSGETVRQGELLVTLETDKVANELAAATDGILEILIPEGQEVAIGTPIARLETNAPMNSISPTSPTSPTGPTSPILPAVPEIPHLPSSAPRSTRRQMSPLRRKIATQLVNAQQSAAILTTFNEVDMSAVLDLRQQVQESFTSKHGVKLGLMSFFIKAVVIALKQVPAINARIDGTDIVENHFYDIGVAISTARGLLVPVLRDCDQKSLARIEQDIVGYAEKSHAGTITLEDLQGGVFTVSNGGVYGSLLSTPILNPPQSGLLGMHTIQQRPVAIAGRVVIRPMMYLALSYDHRLVDGREAVTFLNHVKASLEAPICLILEA
ncbi:MAG: dihydrolipoyllysine-residue succinyltransferase [Verrucomicrobia bacterium]|nr:dihydrolipoyllysine-residue succinyltransferase [Verrucomicrobiota bacterium]